MAALDSFDVDLTPGQVKTIHVGAAPCIYSVRNAGPGDVDIALACPTFTSRYRIGAGEKAVASSLSSDAFQPFSIQLDTTVTSSTCRVAVTMIATALS